MRKDGGSDGRGVGFYFRNVTVLVLFGVRGKDVRAPKPGRTQVNYVGTRKREHSRKPEEIYDLIESCSWGPYLELFARTRRKDWTIWGNEAPEELEHFTGRNYGRAYGDDKGRRGRTEGNITQLHLIEDVRTMPPDAKSA